MLRFITLIIAVALFIQPSCNQESSPAPSWNQATNLPLGWDLTYTSVLEKNNVDRRDWLWKWLNSDYQAPAKKWISEWQGEPIISSILVEYAAFSHAGEHTTIWLFRTQDRAYCWEETENVNFSNKKKELNPQIYDELFSRAAFWQQANPPKTEDLPPQALPGYIGFLSLYEKGKSRQMLLTIEDFIGCASKECSAQSKPLKPGRLFHALMPVWGLEDE